MFLIKKKEIIFLCITVIFFNSQIIGKKKWKTNNYKHFLKSILYKKKPYKNKIYVNNNTE